MSQGSSTVPPPPTDQSQGQPSGDPNTDIQSAGNGGGMDRFRSLISRLSGGGTPAIDKALQQHHDQVTADAQRHAESAKRYYGMIAKAKATGQNPVTGQPVTPQELQTWQQQADGAWADYTKIAGKSKQAKPIIQQMGGLLKHITQHAGAGGGGGQPQPGQQPPSAAGAAPAPATQGSQTVPPPPAAPPSPQATVAPPPGAPSSDMQASLAGPTMDALMKEQDELRQSSAKKEGEESATLTGMAKGLKAVGFTPEQIHEVMRSKVGGAGMRASAAKMHPLMVSDPSDPTKRIPALQSTIPDENGAFPVYDSKGNVIGNPSTLVPAFLETQHTGEMPVYNPATGQIEQQPTYSTTKKIPPKGATSAGGGGGKSSASGGGAPGSSGGSKSRPGSVAPPPGSGGRHGVPMRQFSALQKPATAIDEARNSLIGDDPQKIGGLAADLDVFKSPESVKKIGEYLELVNSQMANEAKQVTGQGPMAAAEWYTGLPQAVIGLQQGALRAASQGLSPQEQRFVADYYRVLGTIGGMRAATGASSAQWSFNALKAELPTPGPVTNYDEAKRRIGNYVRETNVVAKRNPLSQQVDPSKLEQLEGGEGSASLKPPKPADAGKKWQHRTVNGKVEWRQVAAQ